MAGHKYTEEQDQFLRENRMNCSYKELTEIFNEKFTESRSISAISTRCQSILSIVLYKQHNYTSEQDEFLRNNRNSYGIRELTDVFNEKYGASATVRAIESRCRDVLKMQSFKKHEYTCEENVFLKTNRDHVENLEHLTKVFNDKFSTNLNVKAITAHCRKYFGTKTQYNKKQIGEEMSCRGTAMIKTSDRPMTKGCGRSLNWDYKNRVVYENAHGKIPENNIVVFLDKNKNNYALDNLYCITRSIQAIMAQNRWFSTDPVATLTAIKYCELYYAIKQN